jgi:hypothetical protein
MTPASTWQVEWQRAEVAQQAATRAALSKLDRVKEDINARAEALGRDADAEEDKVGVALPTSRYCSQHSA